METGQDLNLRFASAFGRPVHALAFWTTCLFENIINESVSRFAFLPLLCSLYAPLAPSQGWCSSFVATQKHAERGLAYNCASFSRVAASTMLSATLLHLYYFVSISQRSFVTEEPSPRLDFLMVRPLADRGKAYTVHLIGSARRSRSGLSVFSCLGGWFVKDKTCILILSQCRI